jgi:hypothetical protein
MKLMLTALALAAGLAMPALAQEASEAMVCSDFLALGADEQMEAMATAQLGESTEPAEASTPDSESGTAVVAACTENPEMMLGDAMKEALRE